MAYEVFADFYDMLNEDADYGALVCNVKKELVNCGITEGIIADLGCGTGELALQLSKQGYDMIGVDLSGEMLSMFREKLYEENISDILLLQQDLTNLDLYGTIQGAVCTFDTLNHIGPYNMFAQTISRIGLFLEKDCPFIFDMNTPYKHASVLGDNTFYIETDEGICKWQNKYDEANKQTRIDISMTDKNKLLFKESFCEFSYTLEEIKKACSDAGLRIEKIIDGETFLPLTETSQRYFVVAMQNAQRNKMA